MKTTSDTASCMTLSSHIENGPPNSSLPMRFAGTMMQYSANATSQLMTMTAKSPRRDMRSLNNTCPYQASVMNMLEQASNRTVSNPFRIGMAILVFMARNYRKNRFVVSVLSKIAIFAV